MAMFHLTDSDENVLVSLVIKLQVGRTDPRISRGTYHTLLQKALMDAYRLGYDERQRQLEEATLREDVREDVREAVASPA